MTVAQGTGTHLGILETERAILFIKRMFQDNLSESLKLYRVSSPLFVDSKSGLQDNLNGIEKPVSFKAAQAPGREYEIVHSLAKWKRMALAQYKIEAGKGLYTDMNAIRPDEDDLSTRIHSVYVDQWDWEKVMKEGERTVDFLKETVKTIYAAIKKTEKEVAAEFGFEPFLPEQIAFVHTEDLLAQYPDLAPRERETKACQEHGAVFIIGIGGELADGKIHDGRAPDYDDWTTEAEDGKKGLNGDIMVWNPILNRGYELSSMGIRVDPETLDKQLTMRNSEERKALPWHKSLLAGEFPQSIGGGIGQSRLCMLLLQKRHIGEVQVGIWPEEVKETCKAEGIKLL